MRKTGSHGIVKPAKSASKRSRARNRSLRPAPAAPLRERVLQAAFSAFMEKGYAATSTLEIATRAKVSKRELYQVCSNKPGLLLEAISERARRMRLPLELPAAKNRADLTAMLTAFGASTLRGGCEPGVRGVYRLAIAESRQAPEVARTLADARAANRAALAQTLKQAQDAGLIGSGDPAIMVVEFYALLWGDLLLALLLGVAEPPPQPALEQQAQEAVAKFIKLYQ